MIYPTLSSYKENYKANLMAFLNQYEDNTETFFRQAEKRKYQDYQKALTKIANQLYSSTTDELNSILLQRNIATDLKNMDFDIYTTIITELDPMPDQAILSLSAAKNDKIQIDKIALDNHIKSSIVILKFISEEDNSNFESSINRKTENSEYNLESIDRELKTWLQNYQNTNKYINIPLILDEKDDLVVDTFKNYEERNFTYQIEICNLILQHVPNEKNIINLKNRFQNSIIRLRQKHPIPEQKIETIISEINNAFFKLEKYMNGSISGYQKFFFNDAFTIFFNELNKIENVTIANNTLRDKYFNYMSDLYYVYDKGELKNKNAYNCPEFNRDCNEIFYIRYFRLNDFALGIDLEEPKFEMTSIVDTIREISGNNKPEIINIEFEDKLSLTDEENPYPRIFTSLNGFNKFQKLVDEFGNTKQNLSNYSFVYHRMIKDKLIYADYKQTEFVYFLHDFNISIDRIKPKSQLGKADLRESIYNNIK